MNASRTDVRLVCSDCVKPDPKYFEVPPAQFAGWDVKIAFASDEPDSDDAIVENMWVAVSGFEGDHLVGHLINEPLFLGNVRRGDRVELKRTQIEAVESPLGEPFPTGGAGAAHPAVQPELRCIVCGDKLSACLPHRH